MSPSSSTSNISVAFGGVYAAGAAGAAASSVAVMGARATAIHVATPWSHPATTRLSPSGELNTLPRWHELSNSAPFGAVVLESAGVVDIDGLAEPRRWAGVDDLVAVLLAW